MATVAQRWLKRHAAGEKLLSGVLREYFREQTGRIVAAVSDFSHPGPSDLIHFFRAADEAVLLWKAIAPSLAGFIAQGAIDTQSQAAKPKSTKQFDSEWVTDYDLSPEMIAAIEVEFLLLESQPYWQEIQTGTSDKLTSILQEGMTRGLTNWQIAKEIEKTFAGMTRERALMIARTETTAAYNAGHQASYEQLAADGLALKKEWLGIMDRDIRASHAELNGVQVGPKENFNVGGHEAPYPGHPSLPARERVRCRCTTAAAGL